MTRSLALALLTLLAPVALAGEPAAPPTPAPNAAPSADGVLTLKLRSDARVAAGQPVVLADVLDFSAAAELAAAVARQPINTAAPDNTSPSTVTHEQIVARLTALGVNMARVLVSGALQCHVTRGPAIAAPTQGGTGVPPVASTGQRPVPPTMNSTAAAGAGPAPLLRPIVAPNGSVTLGEVLRDHAQREVSVPDATVELQFEAISQPLVELTTPPYEFSVRSLGGDKLGPREFRVVIKRDGRVQRTESVFARLRLTKQVLVARQPLNRGVRVRPEDVTLEARVFDKLDDLGLDRVELVLDQQVERFVPAGNMVHAADVRRVDLVRAGRPVTVLGGGAGVAMQVTGVVLDSGSYGDTVRVRLGDGRQDRREHQAVVTGMSTVRLSGN
jgi:flagella basal body P-ring formation protein FlgA